MTSIVYTVLAEIVVGVPVISPVVVFNVKPGGNAGELALRENEVAAG